MTLMDRTNLVSTDFVLGMIQNLPQHEQAQVLQTIIVELMSWNEQTVFGDKLCEIHNLIKPILENVYNREDS